jgi:hypothetical protein
MELRWLIEVSVMGLLLTVTTSQKYPQPKSTSYPNERAPLANRYNSDRPIMTTDDDYLPVAAIEPSTARILPEETTTNTTIRPEEVIMTALNTQPRITMSR